MKLRLHYTKKYLLAYITADVANSYFGNDQAWSIMQDNGNIKIGEFQQHNSSCNDKYCYGYHLLSLCGRICFTKDWYSLSNDSPQMQMEFILPYFGGMPKPDSLFKWEPLPTISQQLYTPEISHTSAVYIWHTWCYLTTVPIPMALFWSQLQ